MSVIVMGMEMPKSCANCRMAVYFADTGRAKCYATLSYISPERGKRSYNCPLRPLPKEHGRLIDASELEAVAKGRFGVINIGHIDETRTVVEAEGD